MSTHHSRGVSVFGAIVGALAIIIAGYVVLHSTSAPLTSVTPSTQLAQVIGSGVPISFVQMAENAAAVSGTTVATNALSSGVNAGDLLVAWVWYNSSSASVTSVTDSAGNTYVKAVGPTVGAGSLASWSQEIWYAKNAVAGSGVTVTATFSSSFATEKAITVHEYSGADKTSPLDATASAVGSSATPSSGSGITSGSNDLIFGASTVSNTIAAGSGFTQRSGIKGNATEDQIVPSAGSYAAIFSGGAQDWIAGMVAFKPVAAPVVDTTAPSAPAGVTAKALSSSADYVAWTASTDNVAVTGYNVYRDGAKVSSTATNSYTDSGLAPVSQHTYTVSAYDAAGNTSSQSTSVSVTTLPLLPVVSGVSSSGVSSAAATISWTTNTPTDSQVVYGLTTAYGNNTALNSTLTTSHTVTLSGLSANTLYNYQVKSKDAFGNAAVSSNGTFKTAAQFAFVQKSEVAAKGSGSTAVTPAFSGAVSSGDLLVAWVWYNSSSASVTSVNDSLGNAYTKASGPTTGANSLSAWRQELWYAKNVNGGSNLIVTAVFSASFNTEKALSVHDYAGMDQTSPLDATASAIGSSATASTGFGATSASNDLIFGALSDANAATAGTGFNSRSTLKGNVTEDKTVTSAGSYAATFTNTAQDWIASMAAFKIAGSVGGGTNPPPPPTTYTITSSAGTGGSVSPSGATTVNSGASQTYTITPSSGYQVSTVTVDGTAVTSVPATGGSYTFSNISAAHTIAVTFAAMVANSTTFKVGDQVKVITAAVAVRSTPSTSGTAVAGSPEAVNATGVITAAPSGYTNGISAGGYYWWYVTYVNGVVGWSAETYLAANIVNQTPPSVPTALTATAISSSVINLSWTASAGTPVAAGYNILRNGTKIGTSVTTSYGDSGLSASTLYSYTVSAYDAAGDTSAQSTAATATTQAGTTGGSLIQALGIRAIDWSHPSGDTKAGVVGGIPNMTTICSTLNPGATSAQINAAIAACSNGVVYLNAGTYNGLSGININNNNVVLRGAGADKTILKFTSIGGCDGQSADVCIWISGGYDQSQYLGGSINWTGTNGVAGSYTKGATTLNLASTPSGLKAGDLIVLDQADDTGNPANSDIYVSSATGGSYPVASEGCPYCGRGGTRSQQQQVMVTAVGTNSITISPGIYMTNWRTTQSPQIFWFGSGTTIKNVGIENMTVDHTNDAAPTEGRGIRFVNAMDGWVKGIRSLNAARDHVSLVHSKNMEVRDNYFYGTLNAVSQSYGIEPETTADSLVENNVFQHVTSPVVMNYGDEGNVFGYNYMTDMYYSVAAWAMVSIMGGHDAGTALNLYEGNVGTLYGMDNPHGSTVLQTLFRNQFTGLEAGKTEETTPILIEAYHRLTNSIGNVLGTNGYHTVYETSQATGLTGSASSDHSIYTLGFSSSEGNNGSTIPYDPGVASTMLRWGNYDYATKSTRFNASETDGLTLPSTLPASLYLSAKPSWWNTSSWPAIGPDVSGGSTTLDPMGHVSLIPSEQCYQNASSDTTNYSSASPAIKSFNAATCYGTGGSNPPPTTYSVTVSKAGTGTGTVTSTGSINCGSVCSANGTSGQTVNLTAAAATGSTFAGWTGISGCSTATACSFTLIANTTVTATFNTTAIPPSTTFSVGQQVKVITAAVAVRSTPSTSGTAVAGSPEAVNATGIVTAAPAGTTNGVSSGGYYWWYVTYTNGLVGWSAETYLAANTVNQTPPSVPTALTATAVSSSAVNLSWAASAGTPVAAGYNILRNGTKIGTSVTTSYGDTGLTASTLYSYTVSAYDAAGDTSAQTSAVTATTQAGTTGGLISTLTSQGRLPTWAGTVGVPGGIPTTRPICQTLGTAGQAASFAQSVTSSQIQSALDTCASSNPNGSVVLLNPGTYTIASTINLHSYTTLRGSGIDTTILNTSANNVLQTDGSFADDFGAPVAANHINLVSGYQQNSNTIVVADATNIPVGNPLMIDQKTGPNDDATGGYGDQGVWWSVNSPSEGSDRYHHEISYVTAKSGNTLTIDPPIRYSDYNSSMAPQVWFEQPTNKGTTKFAGMENLTLANVGGVSTHGINLTYTYGSWVSSVKVKGFRYGVGTYFAVRSEAIHSEVDGGTSGDDYDFNIFYAGGDLFEDNAVTRVQSAFLLESAIGNAFAYNYTVSPELGSTNGGNMQSGDFNSHGGNNALNLLEGNNLLQVSLDNGWGSANGFVLLRNRVRGWDDPNAQYYNYVAAIDDYAWDRNMTFIGNILGTTGKNTVYEAQSTGSNLVYLTGLSLGSMPNDPLVDSTMVRAMNWDSSHGAIVTGGYSASDVPASLLYTSKPSYFGSLAWPPYDPSNPTSNSGANIPSGYRIINGTDPAGGGNPPPSTYSVTISKAGTGTGTVTSTGSINCGSVCTANGTAGQTVSLTAAAAAGSTFANWAGIAGCSTSTACSFTLTANTTVTATFNTAVIPPSTTFSVGQKVQVASAVGSSGLAVRSTPSPTGTTVTGSPEAINAIGTVTAAPAGTTNGMSAGGFYWWYITYANGLVGWSAEASGATAYLTLYTVVADTQAPTVPTGLSASATSASTVSLSWAASSDNTAVAGYNIYRGGTKIGTSVTTSYSDSGLAASTLYSYTVSAYDAVPNTSAQSTATTVTTQAGGQTGAFPPAISGVTSSSLIDWSQSGVEGGIPNRTYICKTEAVNAAIGTIQADLNACSSNSTALAAGGGVVMLPAGTYSSSGTINIPSNTSLRGAGIGKTLLTGSTIVIGQAGFSEYQNVATNITNASLPAGTTNLTLSSTAGISPGSLIIVNELNDPSIPVTNTGDEGACTWCDSWGGARGLGQIVKVVSVSGSNVTVTPGLYATYKSSLSPLAMPFTPSAVRAGAESLTVYANTGTGVNFFFGNSSNSWLNNVEGNFTAADHVEIQTSYRNEVRHSYFHDAFVHGPGTYDETLMVDHYSSANLVVDNIFWRLHTSVIINRGAAGNVVAYNYSDEAYLSGNANFMTLDLDMDHGSHTSFNLMEGNVAVNIVGDSIWGSSSHNTIFRNYITGSSLYTTPNDTRYSDSSTATPLPAPESALGHPQNQLYAAVAVNITDAARYYNIIGNIVGSPWVKSNSSHAYLTNGSSLGLYNGEAYEFAFGTNESGTYTTAAPFSTAAFEANWDIINGTQSNPVSLPNSLFLSSKPSFFGSLAWPPFNPAVNGSAVASAGVNSRELIPAGYRFVHGIDP